MKHILVTPIWRLAPRSAIVFLTLTSLLTAAHPLDVKAEVLDSASIERMITEMVEVGSSDKAQAKITRAITAPYSKSSLFDAYGNAAIIYEKLSQRVSNEHPLLIEVRHLLILLSIYTGREDDGRRLMREAIKIYHRVYGVHHDITYRAKADYVDAILNNFRGVTRGRHPWPVMEHNPLGIYAVRDPCAYTLTIGCTSHTIKEVFQAPRSSGFLHGLSAAAYGWAIDREPYLDGLEILHRVLSMQIDELGDKHRDTISTRARLGSVYLRDQEYEEAEHHIETVLSWRRETLGIKHPETISSLALHAKVKMDKGYHAEARILFEEVVDNLQGFNGDYSPFWLGVLAEYGYSLSTSGERALGENILAEAFDLTARVDRSSPGHLQAQLYFVRSLIESGNFSRARDVLDDRLHGIRNEFNLELATELDIYRTHLYIYASPKEAARMLLRSESMVPISRARFGNGHPVHMKALSFLALGFAIYGDYSEAIDVYNEMDLIWKEGTLLNLPGFIDDSTRYAVLEVREGLIRSAVDRFYDIIDRSSEYYLSESDHSRGADRRSSALSSFDGAFDLPLALAAHSPTPETANLAARVALSRKGLSAERQAALLRLARQEDDPALRELAARYLLARADFAAAFERLARDLSVGEAAQSTFAATQARLDGLEQELSVASAEFRALEAEARADADAVRATLSPGAALVEQVIFRPYYNFDAKGGGSWGPAHVGAVVLRADADPAFVDLGPLDPLRPMIADLAAQMRAPGDDDGFFAALNLHAALVAPLDTHLAGIETVHLAPAGPLGLIPFDLLLDGDQRPWADAVTLRFTPTGRSLLRAPDGPAAGGGLVAFGAVDFDAASEAVEPTALALAEARQARPQLGLVRSGDLDRFDPLPATGQEVDEVAAIWRAAYRDAPVLHLGQDASEAALRAVRRPQVLHLATHGFIDGQSAQDGTAQGRSALLTGIALAGANSRETGVETSLGLALGYEIEALDLQGTELVVISACDTGRGPDDANEGVYSLARAFGIAGAGAVLVTLKPVDDVLAAQFMAEFYRAWLTPPDGASTSAAEALDTVKQHWAQSTDPAKADPRSWAPFIMMHNRG